MAKSRSGATVAVTGASGYLATGLIRRLAADDAVARIVGFDVRPPRAVHDKLVFDEVDVRAPGLAARLEGVDCLVHLAFVMDPIRDEALMRDVNVNGSQNVFKSAGRAGVSRLVYASSATVYGAHPDNPVPLTEESPLRANLDFSYAAHKLETEYVVREFADEFPDAHVVILRPAAVLGPHADNAWSHLLELPVLFGVSGHAPPLQVVHEDDVARALHWAVTTPESGAFNVAAEGWLEAEEALAIAGRSVRRLPEPLAFAVAERMWRLGLTEVPPGYLHYAMHPWVVSTEKLAAAGFTPETGNEETLREAVAAAAPHVRIGRTRVRRGDLVKGAAAGLGLAGAAGVAAVLRARRRSAA
ncbi:MAG TPA: NAD-dependent epimerase/dehydratase family protein [Actinomycetota bacterium]|nr:NAD-dependent epimerase/dehydratase family protein [Actinomycetota bacterium]